MQLIAVKEETEMRYRKRIDPEDRGGTAEVEEARRAWPRRKGIDYF